MILLNLHNLSPDNVGNKQKLFKLGRIKLRPQRYRQRKALLTTSPKATKYNLSPRGKFIQKKKYYKYTDKK